MIRSKVKKIVSILVLFFCIMSCASCGYFLYPERRGQTKGEIDLPVLVLDCVGLLFFIVPGVVALAVDFSSGTIYLPDSQKSSELREVPFDNTKPLKKEYLETVLASYLGKDINLNNNLIAIRANEDQAEHFAEILKFLNENKNHYPTLNSFALACH
ncbi:MAG: hypothetical protein JXL81_11320 [Deltaproteobacteria bacterium]|nr:hypothetical protein [Deltaproteobacteria bacterium]